METEPPRYLPSRELPPYAFLPGRDPHPTRDPRGHSYSTEPEPRVPYLPAERWSENPEYLFGADLYNLGFLWEAHEAWETFWHVAKRDPLQASFLQGLIQCAAACLKVPMEQPGGLAKLAEQGTARLDAVAREAGPVYMGLDVPDFVERMRAFAASGPATIDARPRIELD